MTILVVVSQAAHEVLHDYTTTKIINNRLILIEIREYFADADSKFIKGADSQRCQFPPKVPMPINRHTPIHTSKV